MTYGLPSTEEQINAMREESELSISHIDTCLSSYVQDHHNRPGECLFGVYVDGTTTRYELMRELIDETRQSGDRVPDWISDDDIKFCIKSLFCEAYGTTEEALALPFNASLDCPPKEEDFEDDEEGFVKAETEWEHSENTQAWFLLVWTPREDEE